MTTSQNASHLLMIRPQSFGFNAETAENNYYQKSDDTPAKQIHEKCLKEFTQFAELLSSHGITITVLDNPNPKAVDAHFPNNWISFLGSHRMALYPMFAKSRRLERDSTILRHVRERFQIEQIVDFTPYEGKDVFCEGTGSLIFDHKNKLAYAALSLRTHGKTTESICQTLGYEPIMFTANQTVGKERLPIYHTNVVMSVGDDFAVICLDSVDNKSERERLKKQLSSTKSCVMELTENQINHFCGNILQVRNQKGESFIVMSQEAFNHFSPSQRSELSKFGMILSAPLSTIEKYGGGSARCMLCEVF